jgi:hypothetical protein
MKLRRQLATLLLVGTALALHAQERYPSGRYKGFTRPAHESNIVELTNVFEVRAVSGFVHYPGRGEGLAGVFIELRDDADLIYATRTDDNGHFRLENLRDGTYTFKAALDGFQSVAGTIVISKHAKPSRRINFDLSLPY